MLVNLASAISGVMMRKGAIITPGQQGLLGRCGRGLHLIGIQRIPVSMSSGKSVAGLMEGTGLVY